MATHSIITPKISGLAATALPIVFLRHGRSHDHSILAGTERRSAALSACDAAAHVHAMNAVHVALNAILAEGGARV